MGLSGKRTSPAGCPWFGKWVSLKENRLPFLPALLESKIWGWQLYLESSFPTGSSKDRVRAVLLQQRCRLSEMQCWDKAGIGGESLLPVTYRCEDARRVWLNLGDSEHTGHILHLHAPVSSPATCPAWMLMGTALSPQSPASAKPPGDISD